MIEYSFVVPIYHDAELTGEFCDAFQQAFSDYLSEDDVANQVELIFVNDDGTAATSAALKSVCDEYEFAKYIELNRNFGQHIALSCGYRHASGAYVGMLNVDQEDPPDQIPTLIDALKDGDAEIALSLRQDGNGAVRRLTSRAFNWVLNRATGYDVPLAVGTLRVMKRAPVDQLNALAERSRYLPGLEAWMGFRAVYVPTKQMPRIRGRSSYNPRRRVRMAFEAIISFSDAPLRFVVTLGMLISLAGFVLAAILAIGQIFSDSFLPGYPSTMAAIVFVGGVQICVIGLAGLYIGRILTEVQRRPLYIVRSRYKLDPEEDR